MCVVRGALCGVSVGVWWQIYPTGDGATVGSFGRLLQAAAPWLFRCRCFRVAGCGKSARARQESRHIPSPPWSGEQLQRQQPGFPTRRLHNSRADPRRASHTWQTPAEGSRKGLSPNVTRGQLEKVSWLALALALLRCTRAVVCMCVCMCVHVCVCMCVCVHVCVHARARVPDLKGQGPPDTAAQSGDTESVSEQPVWGWPVVCQT